jgi:ribosomal protein S18 acetylase RimI-like enzyme
VEANNLPAQALYDAIGLKLELYRYHYRREPIAAQMRAHDAPAELYARYGIDATD